MFARRFSRAEQDRVLQSRRRGVMVCRCSDWRDLGSYALPRRPDVLGWHKWSSGPTISSVTARCRCITSCTIFCAGRFSGVSGGPGTWCPHSRATVRQAFDALVRDGLVYRQRGRGSFVAHPTIEQGIGRIITFTEDMRQRGFAPGTKILSAEVVPAPESIAKELGIGAGDETIRLERLRLADDEPMSLEESWLVHRICRGLLQLDYRSRSLRELLEVHFGLRWARAKQTIRAISASHPLADRLSVPVNSAVLYIERVSFSEEDVPVEFLRLHHRGDRYVLYGELRR